MRVLIACEFSGVVRRAFRSKGHDAWSCDLLAAEDDSEFHIQGDVFQHLHMDWDAMIFHWPCTRICNSGVRWLYGGKGTVIDPMRWGLMEQDAECFRKLLQAPIPKVAGENPIPHRYALKRIGRKYDQIIQPWQHGHGEMKSTCLWLRGLPLLKPTIIVDGRRPRVHWESPGPDRWKNRSRTLNGIASAMAEQWG
jgi:hypothetical protein